MKRKIACSFLGILCALILVPSISLLASTTRTIFTRTDTPYAYITLYSPNADINKVLWEGKYYSFVEGDYQKEFPSQIYLRKLTGNSLVYDSINSSDYHLETYIIIAGVQASSDTIQIAGCTYKS